MRTEMINGLFMVRTAHPTDYWRVQILKQHLFVQTKKLEALNRRGAETQSFILLIAPQALLTIQRFSLRLRASAVKSFWLQTCRNDVNGVDW